MLSSAKSHWQRIKKYLMNVVIGKVKQSPFELFGSVVQIILVYKSDVFFILLTTLLQSDCIRNKISIDVFATDNTIVTKGEPIHV